MKKPLRELPESVAHLWTVNPDTIDDPYLIAAYHTVMSKEEAIQQARYRFPEGRREYLITRALVRHALSAYAPIYPRDWCFTRNQYGRPTISGPTNAPRLRFNLSNTKGLIVCLVAKDREVGVDVENTLRKGETVAVADRFFSPLETAELKSQPPAKQRDRFFDYWTLKEAYIKARGMGLAIPLEHFSYHLENPQNIRISFSPDLQDSPHRWQFSLLTQPPHRIATAIERKGNENPIPIEQIPTVPFAE